MSVMNVMVMTVSINFINIVILNICGVDYCCVINWIDKFIAKCCQIPKKRIIRKIKTIKKSFTTYKMGKEFRMFCNIEIKKQKFHYYKNPILIHDVDINKTRLPFIKKVLNILLGTNIMKKWFLYV